MTLQNAGLMKVLLFMMTYRMLSERSAVLNPLDILDEHRALGVLFADDCDEGVAIDSFSGAITLAPYNNGF